jgi:hypothetical protein
MIKPGDIIEYKLVTLSKQDSCSVFSRVIYAYSTGDVDVCTYSPGGRLIRKFVSKFYIDRVVGESEAESLLILENCFGKWLLSGEP